MRAEAEIKPCIIHKYVQAEKNGVYSIESKHVIKETPFAKLMESFHVLTYRCVRCGHEKRIRINDARWWVLNDKGEK